MVVAVVCAMGTLILQRPDTDLVELFRAYSGITLTWMDRLGFTDLYHAQWFVALLLLVGLSIILASLERWPNAWKSSTRPILRPDAAARATVAFHREFKINDVGAGIETAERALQRLGLKPRRVVENDEISLYSERHRVSVLAGYIVHLSLLLILAGYLLDAAYGYRGLLTLTKGENSNVILVRRGSFDVRKLLPFSIRCDGAGQESYSDGTPRRWWSNIVVLNHGREVESKRITVNDPLSYRGVRIYQSSYSAGGMIEQVELQAQAGDADAKTIILAPNRSVQLDAETTVALGRFIPDYYLQDGEVRQRSDNPVNPAIQLVLTGKDGQRELWVFPGASLATQPQPGGYSFAVRNWELAYSTALAVSYYPGQWAVWGGVLLLMLGLALALYPVHSRFWVMATADAQQQPLLWVGGTYGKNRERFEHTFLQLVESIGAELSGAPQPREARAEKTAPQKTSAGVRRIAAAAVILVLLLALLEAMRAYAGPLSAESNMLYLALLCYAAAGALYVGFGVSGTQRYAGFASAAAALGFLVNTVVAAHRWYFAGHPPLSTMHEALLSFVWTLALLTLIAERRYKVKIIGSITMPLTVAGIILMQLLPADARPLGPALQSAWFHAHEALALLSYAACAIGFALALMFLIQDKMKTHSFQGLVSLGMVALYGSLMQRFRFEQLTLGGFSVPAWDAAQKSEVFARGTPVFVIIPDIGWLFLLILVSCLVPLLLYLSARFGYDKKPYDYANKVMVASVLLQLLGVVVFALCVQYRTYASPDAYGLFSTSLAASRYIFSGMISAIIVEALYLTLVRRRHGLQRLLPSADALDELTYKTIRITFPLLTLMIAAGAYWANQAWGSYWSWEPRETWAAITWLVYAGYLHTRIARGWGGRRAAYLAILGFATIIFALIGVAYLLPGPHTLA